MVFTAHSLPVRVDRRGRSLPEQVAATAGGVAARAGVARVSPGLPERGAHARALARPRRRGGAGRAGARAAWPSVLVVPIGFVSDHTEILYDIDVQARRGRAAAGSRLRRTASLNTSPTFIRALADLVARPRVLTRGRRRDRGGRHRGPGRGPRPAPARRALRAPGGQRPRWGGVIRTERDGGLPARGRARRHPGPEARRLALCRELGLGGRIVPTNPRRARRLRPARAGASTRCPRGWCWACPRGWARSCAAASSPGRRSCAWPWSRGAPRVPPRGGRVDRRVPAPPPGRGGGGGGWGSRCWRGSTPATRRGCPSRATFPRLVELERGGRSLVRGLRRGGPGARRCRPRSSPCRAAWASW